MVIERIRVAPTRTRYYVLLLAVVIYLITYLGRTLISVAAPYIQKEYGFSDQTLGLVLTSYQTAYALFMIPGGWMGDRFGARFALLSFTIWYSVFTALAAFTWSVTSLVVVLFLCGIGAAGAFPIATRSLSDWILPSERGVAQGSTHAGARLGGAIAAPLFALILSYHSGWRLPFMFFAIPGFIWAAIWFWYYRDTPAEHKGTNEAERDLIGNAVGAKRRAARSRRVPWAAILSSRRTWLLSTMYFCYGVVIIIFITWFPKYLSAARHFNLAQIGLYASLPLVTAMVGDLCGGWFSDLILKRTGRINFARRSVAVSGFLLAAISLPVAVLVADPILAIFFFCLTLFGIELTVGNSWAVTIDIGGNYAGSLSAVMSMFGNIGGAIYTGMMGFIIATAGWNVAFFGLAAFSLLGAVLFWFLDISHPLLPDETVEAKA